MNNKEKLKELFGLALEIQMRGKATTEDGNETRAYVSVKTANFSKSIVVEINENGFVKLGTCFYEFNFDDLVERTYQNCRSHLLDLLQKDLTHV